MNKFISNFLQNGLNIGEATFNKYSYELEKLYIDKNTYANIKYSYYNVIKDVYIKTYYKEPNGGIYRKCSCSYNLLTDMINIYDGNLYNIELDNLKKYLKFFKLLIDVNIIPSIDLPHVEEFETNPCDEVYLTENKFCYLP